MVPVPARAQSPPEIPVRLVVINLGGGGAIKPLPHFVNIRIPEGDINHSLGRQRPHGLQVPGGGEVGPRGRQVRAKTFPPLVGDGGGIAAAASRPGLRNLPFAIQAQSEPLIIGPGQMRDVADRNGLGAKKVPAPAGDKQLRNLLLVIGGEASVRKTFRQQRQRRLLQRALPRVITVHMVGQHQGGV